MPVAADQHPNTFVMQGEEITFDGLAWIHAVFGQQQQPQPVSAETFGLAVRGDGFFGLAGAGQAAFNFKDGGSGSFPGR